MSELKSRLNEVERTVVIDDTVRLIDAEVASKGGFSGAALKGGYKVVKKLKGGTMIEFAVDKLLDDFSDALSPLYEDYVEAEEGNFESYLRGRETEAADALLAITDDKARRAKSKVIVKTYDKLRGSAESHVIDALPGVGRLIDTHAPRD